MTLKKIKTCDHTLGYGYSDYDLVDLIIQSEHTEALANLDEDFPYLIRPLDRPFRYCPDCGAELPKEPTNDPR